MLRLSREDSLLLTTCSPFLLGDGADRLKRLAEGEIDWAYVTWRAEQNRTIPLLEYHLRNAGLTDRVPRVYRDYILKWTTLSRIRSIFEHRHLLAIMEALDREGIAFFLVKGPDLALLHYPDPLLRPMTDVDIMIRSADAFRVRELMFHLGYRNGLFNPATGEWTDEDKPLTREVFQETYALPVFVKIEKLQSPFSRAELPPKLRHRHVKGYIDADKILHIPIFIDLHFNLSVGIDEEDIWAGVELANVLGRVARVQSPTAAVWFLSARIYHEAFLYNSLRLIMLGDLHAVLRRRLDQVDWGTVAAIAFKYEMRPGIYYVLELMRRTFDVDIPVPLLDMLRPDQAEIPLQHDWGDILPKLLSVPHLNEVVMA